MSEKEMEIVDDMPDFGAETPSIVTPQETPSIMSETTTSEVVLALMNKQANEGWDMSKCVDYYVKWVALHNPVFAERLADKEKSQKQCLEFITSEARENIKGSQGVVNDITCYGWAVHYYTETNDALGIKKPVAVQAKPQAKAKTPVKQTAKTPVKPQETGLFAQSSNPVATASTNVVVHPATAKKLTSRELKRGDDCGFLF